MSSEAIRSVCRVRPLSAAEARRGCSSVVAVPGGAQITVLNPRAPSAGAAPGRRRRRSETVQTFDFDAVLGDDATQAEVFEAAVAPLIPRVVGGLSATVLAYGQTGSGKTYTLEGRGRSEASRGLVLAAAEGLFREAAAASEADGTLSFVVFVRAVEIYNEELRDLLLPVPPDAEAPQQLAIKESRRGDTTVAGATRVRVRAPVEAYALLLRARKARQTAGTERNDRSSRSHCVFTFEVRRRRRSGAAPGGGAGGQLETAGVGLLRLVDLAGSERSAKGGAAPKAQLAEAVKINQSLTSLGMVVAALGRGDSHVPYRNSVLTRLLRSALGGTAAATLVACVSPAHDSYGETVGTLRFAASASRVHNRPALPPQTRKDAVIEEYREQIALLQRQLEDQQATAVAAAAAAGDTSAWTTTPGTRAHLGRDWDAAREGGEAGGGSSSRAAADYDERTPGEGTADDDDEDNSSAVLDVSAVLGGGSLTGEIADEERRQLEADAAAGVAVPGAARPARDVPVLALGRAGTAAGMRRSRSTPALAATEVLSSGRRRGTGSPRHRKSPRRMSPRRAAAEPLTPRRPGQLPSGEVRRVARLRNGGQTTVREWTLPSHLRPTVASSSKASMPGWELRSHSRRVKRRLVEREARAEAFAAMRREVVHAGGAGGYAASPRARVRFRAEIEEDDSWADGLDDLRQRKARRQKRMRLRRRRSARAGAGAGKGGDDDSDDSDDSDDDGDEDSAAVPLDDSELNEFREILYSPVTTDNPFDFARENYAIRATDLGRSIELLVVVTAYNEDAEHFNATMDGLARNLDVLEKNYGEEYWKRVLVVVMCDGRTRASESLLAAAAGLGMYDERLLAESPFRNGNGNDYAGADPDGHSTVRLHMFEHTARLHKDRNYRSWYPPMQTIFAIKEANGGKLDSHLWFFNGFAAALQPRYTLMVDVGTRPRPRAIYALVREMELYPRLGGVCGELRVSNTSLVNPVVSAQMFEYQAAHVLDKSTESALGYIQVLPGAFSLYRYDAIKADHTTGFAGPLAAYFRSLTTPAVDMSALEANMMLTEDRILCFELITQRRRGWMTRFVRDSVVETDVPSDLATLAQQRRRWMNGALFTTAWVLLHSPRFFRGTHSLLQKCLFAFQVAFTWLTLLAGWFAPGTIYLGTFAVLAATASSTVGTALAAAYHALLVALLIFSLANRVRHVAGVFRAASGALGCIVALSLALAVDYMLGQSGGQDPLVLAAVGLVFGTMFLVSALWGRLLPALATSLSYVVMFPSFQVVFAVYSLCNTHDVSWGTRQRQQVHVTAAGGWSAVTVEGGAYTVPDARGGRVARLGAVGASKLRAQVQRDEMPHSQLRLQGQGTSRAAAAADAYRRFRSFTVLLYVITNVGAVRVVTGLGGVSSFFRYGFFVLAGYMACRALGALSFLATDRFRSWCVRPRHKRCVDDEDAGSEAAGDGKDDVLVDVRPRAGRDTDESSGGSGGGGGGNDDDDDDDAEEEEEDGGAQGETSSASTTASDGTWPPSAAVAPAAAAASPWLTAGGM